MEDTLKELYEKLLVKQNEVIKFYTQIMDNQVAFLHVHGIKASKEEIEKGQRLRDEVHSLIDQIKNHGLENWNKIQSNES
jgi:hypothetical protein